MTMPLTELNKLIERITDFEWHVNAYNLEQVIMVSDGPDREGNEYVDGRHQYAVANTSSGNTFTWRHRQANAEFIAASRTALPNALRVIAECKRQLESVGICINQEAVHDAIDEALATIETFERDVLQQEKM